MALSALPVERTWTLNRIDDAIEDAQRFASRALETCDAESQRAVTMAVIEFTQNLVKYGARGVGSTPSTIEIAVASDRIQLRVTNDVLTTLDAQYVQSTVAELQACSSVDELFQSRARALLADPDVSRTRLGLLRVAYEGRFRLTCSFEPPRLQIIAERSCRSIAPPTVCE